MFTRIIYCFLCCHVIFVLDANAARILAITHTNAYSHFRYQEIILELLAGAGHQVTFLSSYAPANPANNITYVNTGTRKLKEKSYSASYFRRSTWPQNHYLIYVHDTKRCEEFVKLNQTSELLYSSDRKFDVLFSEIFSMEECYFPIARKLGIPIIGVSNLRSYPAVDYNLGNPRNPAVIPFEMGYVAKAMSFYERLTNVYDHLLFTLFYEFYEMSEVRKFHHKHYPSYDGKKNDLISVVFVNSHPSLFPRPTVPNMIEVGGITVQTKTQPLPHKLKTFIEESEHGVIYFSFGTWVEFKTDDLKMRNAFRDAFAKLPQRVIWKSKENIENLTDNVLLTSWAPQQDILAHENVKAFISHCGINSVYEAIYHAKPMILIPLFCDQSANAALLHELGVGIHLDFYASTAETLVRSLDTLINDTSYRRRMQKLSLEFRDRPMTPQQTVLYWTEYVLRHNGTQHLKTAATDMPLYQYLLLDVILFVVVVLSIGVYTVYQLLRGILFLCIHLRSRRKTKISLQEKVE